MSSPVISIAQMREWEQATWAGGQTEAEVIRRVGKAVAELALRLTRPGELIVILAGKGHNGDDARGAQEHLVQRRLEVLAVTEPGPALPELEKMLAGRPALIIDGLFGIGLDRPLSFDWRRLVHCVNESRIPVLAIDVPSGLNADTGEPQGGAIRAAVTLTVGTPKAGLVQDISWEYVGRLEVAREVGLAPCPHASEVQWVLPEDFHGYPPARGVATHKGTYGHLIIVAGSHGYHGAAVLAAHGAQRAQPGLVTVYTTDTVYAAVAAQLQASMVSTWQPNLALPERASAILAGPGLAGPEVSDELKLWVRQIWRGSPLPVVVDASAFSWLRPEPVPRHAIRVVTPHPGEAARLLGTTTSEIDAKRFFALRKLSGNLGDAFVVLKGHQTLVGQSAGPIHVNSSGNPHLAQGGSGDLLAGYAAGFLAQPALQQDPALALRYAVWQHGAAADRLQAIRRNWSIEDLAEELGR